MAYSVCRPSVLRATTCTWIPGRAIFARACTAKPSPQPKWQETKYVYTQLIGQRYDYELAETFFNSIYRRLQGNGAGSRELDPDQMYVHSAFGKPPLMLERPIYDVFTPAGGVKDMLRRLLFSLNFARPWRDFDRDINTIVRSLTEELPQIDSTENLEVHLLRSLFIRNKGAYAIGRLLHGNNAWPVALALLTDEAGQLYVDTLICNEDELSIIFSFTRSYFIVDTRYPSALVDFLHSVLPNKKRSELYASIGLHKHGKTEFYRGFLQHLDESDRSVRDCRRHQGHGHERVHAALVSDRVQGHQGPLRPAKEHHPGTGA